jgi:hypothetical protein
MSIMWPQTGHSMKCSASPAGVRRSGRPGVFGGGVILARRTHGPPTSARPLSLPALAGCVGGSSDVQSLHLGALGGPAPPRAPQAGRPGKPKPYKCSICGAEVPDLPMLVLKHQMSHVKRRPHAGDRLKRDWPDQPSTTKSGRSC